MEAVGAGLGVAPYGCTPIEALGLSAGVVFRPVSGLAQLDVWVARRGSDERAEVLAFQNAAIAALRTG